MEQKVTESLDPVPAYGPRRLRFLQTLRALSSIIPIVRFIMKAKVASILVRVTHHVYCLFCVCCTALIYSAQEVSAKMNETLVREWQFRYIKMDFMDDTAIEGDYG